MALSKLTSTSINDIEEQIAKITAELEKARALHYLNAEKTFLAAQKRTTTAQAKVNDLNAKASTTAAAQSRLALAKAALSEQESLLADAESVFNDAKAEQDAADEFAKNVALVLSGKKLGKKIKFSKKEKAVIKEDKKAAKKITKQEKKTAKKQLKDEKKKQLENSSSESVVTSIDSTTSTTEKATPKKAPAKKALEKKPTEPQVAAPKKAVSVKKTAPAKKVAAKKIAPVAGEITPQDVPVSEPESTTIPLEASVQEPANPLPSAIGAETPATETGHDVVVETETLPPSENQSTENDTQKPVND